MKAAGLFWLILADTTVHAGALLGDASSVRLYRQARRGVLANSRRQRVESSLQPYLESDENSWQSGGRMAANVAPSIGGGGIVQQQQLFRYSFLVCSDMCIRLPNEASTLLRAFVVHTHLTGVIHLQLDAFCSPSKVNWSPDAARMLALPNAGGSSLLSEALALELLARAFGASLERTEMELAYEEGSKMTDFAVTLFGGYQLGVSVTRAYKWRGGQQEPYGLGVHEAKQLLVKKLNGINHSSRNVKNFRWTKQILCVWAFCHKDAVLLEQMYAELPASLRANTVLLITRCDGAKWIR